MKIETVMKKKGGQNTAEYTIMLTLVAVAAIGLFSIFGQTIRQKMNLVVAAISGNAANYGESRTALDTTSDNSETRANTAVQMQGQDAEELSSQAGANP